MNQATQVVPRRPAATSVVDRRRAAQAAVRKAAAETFIGHPGAVRRVLNGGQVTLSDPDVIDRLKAVRATEVARVRRGHYAASELLLDDIDGALVAARWARRFRQEAA